MQNIRNFRIGFDLKTFQNGTELNKLTTNKLDWDYRTIENIQPSWKIPDKQKSRLKFFSNSDDVIRALTALNGGLQPARNFKNVVEKRKNGVEIEQGNPSKMDPRTCHANRP